MKKIVYIFITLFLFFYFPKINISLAQSPIRCGLLNEACCNLAGSSPDSCQSGLICSNGICVDNPNSNITPPTRGTVNSTPGSYAASPLTGDCLDTAIGCIPLEENALITFFLKWAIGLGGGIAFLLLIYSGFIILTSQGVPERLKAGQELLSSALMGLILLIFSVFILRIIGVDLLGIPGF